MNGRQRKAVFANLPAKYKVGRKLLSEDEFKKYNSEKRCDIVRFRFNGNSRVVKRDVPEGVARLHCNDPRTRKEGVWFDGFRYRN